MRRQGFTLIELIITMVIIVIMSTAAFISLNSKNTIILDAAAKKIAGDLKYVQNLAISTSQWYGIVFAADPANSYTVYLYDGNNLVVIDDPAASGKDFIVNLDETYKGVKISNVTFDFGTAIYFHPLGTPYVDFNGNEIINPGSIVLDFYNKIRTINVTPGTGYVTINN
ncbi:MAG: prepilin-type N-terminal cleavage/methylation domain-containing protein [bacterium]